MHRRYKEFAPLRYGGPTPPLIAASIMLFIVAGAIKCFESAINSLKDISMRPHISLVLPITVIIIIALGVFAIAVSLHITCSDSKRLEYMIMTTLCNPKYGNPLKLREGQVLPKVAVVQYGEKYKASVSCLSADPEDVASLQGVISSGLTGRFAEFSVTATEEDIAGRNVSYTIENTVAKVHSQDVIRYIG